MLARRRYTDDGGHLLAAMFNGPGEQINYVPMAMSLNQAGGEWYKMEQVMKEALRGSNPPPYPKKVEIEIAIVYGADKRPTDFNVNLWIDKVKKKRSFSNKICTMATTAEIYAFIGQTIIDDITEDGWQVAILDIEYTGGDSTEFGGFYIDESDSKQGLELEAEGFNVGFSVRIQELHAVTTAENSNRWNRLRYTLKPDKTFEIDFIWDEDLAEIMAYINSTVEVPEPKRGTGLDRLKQEQLARKTARIYDGIVQVLLQNAPAPAWEVLLLSLTWPPLHYAAQAQTAPGRRTSSLLLGEEAAVQALEELTANGDHLGWESATLVVEPSGQYRYSFVWAGAGEFNLPTHYHHEGQVRSNLT